MNTKTRFLPVINNLYSVPFEKIDTDGNGKLSKKEVKAAKEKYGNRIYFITVGMKKWDYNTLLLPEYDIKKLRPQPVPDQEEETKKNLKQILPMDYMS